MNYGRVLAIILIFFQAATSAGYAYQHDWRHAAYWFFATGITASVTF